MTVSFSLSGAIAPFPVKPVGAGTAQAGNSPKSHSVTGTRPSAAKSSSDSDSGSITVQTLRQQLERLQKQLAQQERQLRSAVARDKDNDPTHAPRIAALQSAVSTTMGQIAETVARLAAALMAESGSSSGGLVRSAA